MKQTRIFKWYHAGVKLPNTAHVLADVNVISYRFTIQDMCIFVIKMENIYCRILSIYTEYTCYKYI